MKNWIAAVAAVASMTVGGALAAPWTLPDLGEHIAKTNVLLNGGCSGTVIDAERGLILTAHHCLKKTQSIEFTQYSGPDPIHRTMTPAAVVAEAEAHDLALLQVDIRLPFTWEATLHDGDVGIGSDVWIVGNPHGIIDNTVSRGILGSKHEISKAGGKSRHVWVTDARMIGGNSGGAAYTDGRLIGVSTSAISYPTISGARAPSGINFIIPLPTVRAFLAEYEVAAAG